MISIRSSASASYSRSSAMNSGSPPSAGATFSQVCRVRLEDEQITVSGRNPCEASQLPVAALSRCPPGRRARSKSGPPGSSPALACRNTTSLCLSCLSPMASTVGHWRRTAWPAPRLRFGADHSPGRLDRIGAHNRIRTYSGRVPTRPPARCVAYDWLRHRLSVLAGHPLGEDPRHSAAGHLRTTGSDLLRLFVIDALDPT